MNPFIKMYNAIKEQGKIEDKDGIIRIEPPDKVTIEPKDPERLDEIYEETIIKLKNKGLLRVCACYKENGKIILQKV